MTVETSELEPDVMLVRLVGECDMSQTARLEQAIREAAAAARHVRIDLSGVEFMDSSALNVLYQAKKELESDSRRLVLVAPQSQIMRVFEITRLGGYFEFADAPAASDGQANGNGAGHSNSRVGEPTGRVDEH